MLKIDDRIKYVKANLNIEFPIGTEFTVTDMFGVTIVVMAEYKIHGTVVGRIQGMVSYDEYEKYFEKCKPEIVSWSEWEKFDSNKICYMQCDECDNCFCSNLCSFMNHYSNSIQYKHNNKKVLVKVQLSPSDYLYPNAPKGKILRAYASCCPEDKFDLNTGIKVALIKINNEIAKQIIKANNNILENI